MKVSNFLTGAASVVLALATTATLQSCSNEDNSLSHEEIIELQEQRLDQMEQEKYPGELIIKEFNVGGGYKTIEGNKTYSWCKGLVLYNNGATAVTHKNLAIGTIPPGNAHANNGNYEDGELVYENEDYVPMIYAIWYNPNSVTVKPFEDLVIAINGAVDHSAIATGAFDLSKPEYHAMYDPESQYINPNAYPEPAAGIPAANYWKAAVFGLGNAWAISVMCPNFILFQFPEGVDPAAYCAAPENAWYDAGKQIAANYCVKIPKAWIIDGVESYRTTMIDYSVKRLPASIDTGYALYNSNKGYSAYRNVDKKATESLRNNADKLIYNYDQAVEGTSDASGIDAAASLKNGAKIIYKDTDNSTADFHLRKDWSLK